MKDFKNMRFRATCKQNVGHGKIRLTKSPCEEVDEIDKFGFGCAFIKGINNKGQRQTLAQSGSKPPESLRKRASIWSQRGMLNPPALLSREEVKLMLLYAGAL
jgi:hypothetical protein